MSKVLASDGPGPAMRPRCRWVAACLVLLAGCRQEMYDQPKYEPLEPSDFFADGRSFPEDMNPSWFGYSIGRWEKDTFVVETAGFNDKGWLDNFGKPATDKLRVTERFVRKDFGHMDIVITIDDPGAYTKPWDVTLPLILRPDTELLEYICNENNKYFEIIPKVEK